MNALKPQLKKLTIKSSILLLSVMAVASFAVMAFTLIFLMSMAQNAGNTVNAAGGSCASCDAKKAQCDSIQADVDKINQCPGHTHSDGTYDGGWEWCKDL